MVMANMSFCCHIVAISRLAWWSHLNMKLLLCCFFDHLHWKLSTLFLYRWAGLEADVVDNKEPLFVGREQFEDLWRPRYWTDAAGRCVAVSQASYQEGGYCLLAIHNYVHQQSKPGFGKLMSFNCMNWNLKPSIKYYQQNNAVTIWMVLFRDF